MDHSFQVTDSCTCNYLHCSTSRVTVCTWGGGGGELSLFWRREGAPLIDQRFRCTATHRLLQEIPRTGNRDGLYVQKRLHFRIGRTAAEGASGCLPREDILALGQTNLKSSRTAIEPNQVISSPKSVRASHFYLGVGLGNLS